MTTRGEREKFNYYLFMFKKTNKTNIISNEV